MKVRRLAALGSLAFGVSLAMLSPAVAGADTIADPGSPTAVQGTTVTSSPDFAAFQSGDQETPPNVSPAWSYVVFNLSADGSTPTYAARAFGLANPNGAHLHLGAPGVAGPIVVPLKVPGQPGTSGCVNVATGATFERAGTGSGAVALALLDERPDLRVSASDVSPAALAVARANAARLGLEVELSRAGGLPEGLAADLVLANMPYVAEHEWPGLQPEITRYEPRAALVSGADGLDAIRALVAQAAPGTRLALEHAPWQARAVRDLLSDAETRRDLAGRERVTVGRAP